MKCMSVCVCVCVWQFGIIIAKYNSNTFGQGIVPTSSDVATYPLTPFQ